MEKLDPTKNVYKCTYAVMHAGKPTVMHKIVITDKKPYEIAEKLRSSPDVFLSVEDVEILNDKYTEIFTL